MIYNKKPRELKILEAFIYYLYSVIYKITYPIVQECQAIRRMYGILIFLVPL